MSDLRYALQFRRHREIRWRLVQSYEPSEEVTYQFVHRVMEKLAERYPTWAFRIIEQPGNILAAEIKPTQDRS